MKKSVVFVLVLAALIVLTATPAEAATRLTRYHCDANFNQAVGATFQVWWPCTTDWTSWGTTSYWKEVIVNWDDCESGTEVRTCWIYNMCCGTWTQVNCP